MELLRYASHIKLGDKPTAAGQKSDQKCNPCDVTPVQTWKKLQALEAVLVDIFN